MNIGDTFQHSSIHTYYDSSDQVINTENYTIEVTLLAKEDVTVRAGKFEECLKFWIREFDEGEWYEHTVWLAPGVGDVMTVGEGSHTRELLGYPKGKKTYYPVE